MSAVLAVGVCTPVQAANPNPSEESGVIEGTTCYATLGKYYSYAYASTRSSLVAYHHVDALLRCHYTDDNIEIKYDTFTAKSDNSTSVAANATVNALGVWDQYAERNHQITYGSYTWTKHYIILETTPVI